jgi:hypothetical protein
MVRRVSGDERPGRTAARLDYDALARAAGHLMLRDIFVISPPDPKHICPPFMSVVNYADERKPLQTQFLARIPTMA